MGFDSRTTALTTFSLLAFAANSILCRLALARQHIDAASFTGIRLLSGAVVLGVLALGDLRRVRWPGTVQSTAALCLYAIAFSFAYLRLRAGVGALILFGCVQFTMISWGIARGERPRRGVWLGLAVAFGGLVGLTAPGLAAPDPVGALEMAVAGASWAAYTLHGRAARTPPLATTAANFIGGVPIAIALLAAAATSHSVHVSTRGIILAMASGALASGLGYALWYSALRRLTATRAAILQLLVPILAALGGVALGEVLAVRLIVAGVTILTGVTVAIRARA